MWSMVMIAIFTMNVWFMSSFGFLFFLIIGVSSFSAVVSHSTHSWHSSHASHHFSHVAHAAHASHTGHSAHSTHTGHASHAAAHIEILHIAWVEISTYWLFFFFIFICPFSPINLDMWVLCFIFSQPWPVFSFLVLLHDIQHNISAFCIPFAFFNVYFIK
jgi:hypothetical protein